MPEFRGTLTVTSVYDVVIEADTKEEAEGLLEDYGVDWNSGHLKELSEPVDTITSDITEVDDGEL